MSLVSLIKRRPPEKLVIETNGAEVPDRVTRALLDVLPPGTNLVHILSHENPLPAVYRVTAVCRDDADHWYFVVSTNRFFSGRTCRVQPITEGTARALLSQQQITGLDAAHAEPLGGLLTSRLAP